MYTRIYMCVCVYIYIYICVSVYIHTHICTYFRITRVNIILIISINICRTVTYHKAFSDGKINFGKSRVKIMHINSSMGRKQLYITCKITKGVISEYQSLQTDTMAMVKCMWLVTADRKTIHIIYSIHWQQTYKHRLLFHFNINWLIFIARCWEQFSMWDTGSILSAAAVGDVMDW